MSDEELIREALEELRADTIADELQARQIVWLQEALQSLDAGTEETGRLAKLKATP